jgi:glyoxylase-like metal-dependent hydrolase (beta-lactamase superfamily II)
MQRIIYRDLNVTIFQSALFQTNSTVVCTDDVIIVVDPAWLPDEVLSIKQYVDTIKGRRPVFLVFTHSDYDHVIGYGAFQPDKVFATKTFTERTDKDQILAQISDFDQQYYIERPYKVTFPEPDFLVYKDGVQYRHGRTKLTFYMAPGHTNDSLILVVWQLGLCLAGDYLCNTEFPFIYHNSVDYENTLHKLTQIHDRNWFTRLVPGHGLPALHLNDWLKRRIEALAYIYAARESIATGQPFEEDALWERYRFPKVQLQFHKNNMELLQREFEEGLWTWDQEISKELFQRRRGKHSDPILNELNQEDEEEDDN